MFKQSNENKDTEALRRQEKRVGGQDSFHSSDSGIFEKVLKVDRKVFMGSKEHFMGTLVTLRFF